MSFARRVQRDTDSLPQFIPSSERIAGEQRDRCDAFGTRHSRRRVHARATLVPLSRKRTTVRGSQDELRRAGKCMIDALNMLVSISSPCLDAPLLPLWMRAFWFFCALATDCFHSSSCTLRSTSR